MPNYETYKKIQFTTTHIERRHLWEEGASDGCGDEKDCSGQQNLERTVQGCAGLQKMIV